MNKHGKVIEIFSAKQGQSGLPRPISKKLEILINQGIKDDKFAGKNVLKDVMIVGKIAYDIAEKNGIYLELGSLGENILLDFNPHDYKVGSILKISSLELEITQSCTICNHLSVFDEQLPFLLKDCRGLYCKIVSSGNVVKDDKIEIINKIEVSKKIAS